MRFLFLNRVHHGPAFDDVVRDGFLAIDVQPLASLAGINGMSEGVRVVMIGSADDDGIEVLPFVDQLAIVLVGRDLVSGLVGLLEPLHGLGDLVLVDVAQGDDLEVRQLDEIHQVISAHAAAAHQGDGDLLVGGDLFGIIGRRDPGGPPRGGDSRTAQEGASMERHEGSLVGRVMEQEASSADGL